MINYVRNVPYGINKFGNDRVLFSGMYTPPARWLEAMQRVVLRVEGGTNVGIYYHFPTSLISGMTTVKPSICQFCMPPR
jgi:hypothetical protein